MAVTFLRQAAVIGAVREPAAVQDDWSVQVELAEQERSDPHWEEWIQEAVLGMLDVLMTRCPCPVLNVKLRIVGAIFDPVCSSDQAFRMAGRDAADKLPATAFA